MKKLALVLFLALLVVLSLAFFNFSGNIRDFFLNGQGIRISKDGTKFQGTFKKGKLEGAGIYIKSNGDMYEGEFKNDLPNGMGKLTLSDGRMYEGHFKDGEFKGKLLYEIDDPGNSQKPQ